MLHFIDSVTKWFLLFIEILLCKVRTHLETKINIWASRFLCRHYSFVCIIKSDNRMFFCLCVKNTVGVIKNGTLVFVDFSAQDASILKISVPIIKRRSWGFQNPPTCEVWMILNQVLTFPKNRSFWDYWRLLVFWAKLSIKIIFVNFYFLYIPMPITRLIIISILISIFQRFGSLY